MLLKKFFVSFLFGSDFAVFFFLRSFLLLKNRHFGNPQPGFQKAPTNAEVSGAGELEVGDAFDREGTAGLGVGFVVLVC